MGDYFLQRMEGDQAGGGDLTDIVRAGGAMPGNSNSSVAGDDLPSTAAADEWHHLQQPMLFPPSSSSDAAGPGADVFGAGDPFAGLGDPFSSDYSSCADFVLDGAMPDAMAKVGFDAAGISGGGQMLDMGCGGRKPLLPRGMGGIQQQMPGMAMGAPSRLMPSPALSPIAIRPYTAMTAGDMVKLGITAGQAAGCAIDAAVAGMQMSSPRTAGIKRRKNQARKVVCIPAPTTAGSRPTGEVVPSDLWAWRKYGQKPIKGSPHPRGYYRCSSSKGCSARKQVERSRTDPNMLVITYTSEHNHPWPTQRNALAGSTRSHHGKNGGSGSSGAKSSQNEKQPQANNNVKEERKDHQAAAATTTTTSTITTTTSTASPMIVKLEETLLAGSSEALLERDHQRAMDTAAGELVDHSDLMDHVFSESYRPMIPESGHHEDFFADLAELESDPMSLIFSKEYMEARPSGTTSDHGQEKAVVTKDLDPFDMLDWSATSTAGSTFEQGKGG